MVSCAHAPQPPSKEARASFGRVGIYAPAPDDINFEAPTSGRLAGGGKGTLGALEGIASSAGGGEAWLGVALLSPVFALGGFIYGTVAAEPAAKVQGWEEAVRRAVDGVDIVHGLRDGIVQRARVRGLDIAVVENVSVTEGRPDYSQLCAMGIDTVVEAQVLNCSLEGNGSIDPPVQFVMEARVRVIRPKDGAVIYSNTFKYLGQKMTYAHWAAMTVVLRNQINTAIADISDRAVERVFSRRISLPRIRIHIFWFTKPV
jgi:hypothetical protein